MNRINYWTGFLAAIATIFACILAFYIALPELQNSRGAAALTPPILSTNPALDTPSALPPASVPGSQTIQTSTPVSNPIFHVYTDAAARDNHFFPTGKMGDTGDITLNQAWRINPHSGATAIKIIYDAQGQGPYHCDRNITPAPSCTWAGVYWQNPENNWTPAPQAGYNLTEFSKLTFWARSDGPANIEFKVGNITGTYPDSVSSGIQSLTDAWQQYEIPLASADLSCVSGGFEWDANWGDNGIAYNRPKTLVFYLDDIQFER